MSRKKMAGGLEGKMARQQEGKKQEALQQSVTRGRQMVRGPIDREGEAAAGFTKALRFYDAECKIFYYSILPVGKRWAESL